MAYVRWHALWDNPEHPPLTKLLSGVAMSGVHVTTKKQPPNPHGSAGGARVLYDPGDDATRLLWRARLPMLLLTVLFGAVVLLFTRDLFGPAGALLAVAVYSLDPNLAANGQLATNDLAVAGFLLTTSWLLWRARHRGRPFVWLGLAGLAFGAALASKMTASRSPRSSSRPAVAAALIASTVSRRAARLRGLSRRRRPGVLTASTRAGSTRRCPPTGVHGTVAVFAAMRDAAPVTFDRLIGGRKPIATVTDTVRIYELPQQVVAAVATPPRG